LSQIQLIVSSVHRRHTEIDYNDFKFTVNLASPLSSPKDFIPIIPAGRNLRQTDATGGQSSILYTRGQLEFLLSKKPVDLLIKQGTKIKPISSEIERIIQCSRPEMPHFFTAHRKHCYIAAAALNCI